VQHYRSKRISSPAPKDIYENPKKPSYFYSDFYNELVDVFIPQIKKMIGDLSLGSCKKYIVNRNALQQNNREAH